MNGSAFKRRLPSGTIVWAYKFDAGRDPKGKRLYGQKSGYETETAASAAMRDAIIEYEKTHGKVTKHRGILGDRDVGLRVRRRQEGWFRGSGRRRGRAYERDRAPRRGRASPSGGRRTFAEYVGYWLDKHASRTLAPKTLERYREFAGYLIRHLGKTPRN